MTRLAGEDGSGGLLGRARAQTTDAAGLAAVEQAVDEAQRWRDLHKRIRELDDSGRYPEAVQLAVGNDADTTGAVFSRLDEHLARGIAHAGDRFAREVRGAGDAFRGVAGGLGVLSGLALVGVLIGMAQRILEYR
jgi:hypothetical protein